VNSEGQITVREWFALPKAERRARAETFREADEALQANGDAEQAAGIDWETDEYHRLNHRVNDLWPTVPWWVKAPALPHVAADIARLAARMRGAARGRDEQAPAPPCPHGSCHHNHPERRPEP
jgi:hypothetical protein